MRRETSDKRVRKINRDDLWRLVIFRALGFSQKDIADRLDVKQEAISYHLRQIRRVVEEDPDKVYDVFVDIILESERGTHTVLGGINQKLYGDYRRRKFGPRRR